MKKTTMQDIADKLGITKVSVSRAINNKPGLGNELRDKILKTAQEMNYKRIPGTVTSAHFAYVCPKRYFLADDYFYTKIYYYINSYCIKHNYNCDCLIIHPQDENDARLPIQLTTKKFDGIFIGGELSDGFLRNIEKLNSEVVAIDFYKEDFQFNYVTVENYFAGQNAARYLHKRGHCDIGFIGDYKLTSSLADRFFGYVKYLKLHDLTFRNEAVFPVLDISCSQPISPENIELPSPMPTAFICHSDKAAFVLMQLLESKGYTVPDNVSLISFDNTQLSEIAIPQLTTVDIDRKKLSNIAIDIILERLNNPSKEKNFHTISTKIIERNSVKVI